MANFDPRQGFRLESPAVFVRWGLTEGDLVFVFPNELRRVTDGYYTVSCVSLGGLQHELGFHFRPSRNGRLAELEFFRRSYSSYPKTEFGYADLTESFEEFQRHLELTFGPPSDSDSGLMAWDFGTVELKHWIQDRFEPEEKVRLSLRQAPEA